MSRLPRAGFARLMTTISLPALLPLGACVGYEPAPLDPVELFARIEAERHAPRRDDASDAEEQDTILTLAAAAEWLRAYGPTVRETVAAWRTAQAVADTPVPWPNPTIAAGPQYGFGDADLDLPATTWFVTLGATVPLGGRIGAQDDVNAARAAAARIDAELELRQQYLELRRSFAAFAIARARADLLQETAEIAAAAARVGRQLAEAGRIGALDVALLDLESSRRVTDRMRADLDVADRRGELASLCGVAGERFDAAPLEAVPALGAEPPVYEELRELMIRHNAELLRLRAQYEVSEQQLRLEITRQYPDLQLQLPFSKEPGEDLNILGLSLGIEVPVFDRNQPAIARATKARDEQRERYVAAARRALAELGRAQRAAELTRSRRMLLEEIVVPRARANVELTRQTLEAGQGDALKLLEVQRSSRDVELELLDARTAELRAWSDLELVVGRPLIEFPGEAAEPPRFADTNETENPS